MVTLPALVLSLFLLASQDDFGKWLGRLSDDSPAIRDEAAGKLIQGYHGWRLHLEKALVDAGDADLRVRLQQILAEGEFRAHKSRFAAALPDRIRRMYPDFAEALFSKRPERRLEAMKALGRTYHPGDAKAPFPQFYLSPSEAKKAMPEMIAVLDPGPEYVQVRHEWVGVLFGRQELLDDPEWAEWARRLFRDSETTLVRDHAFGNLANKVLRSEDVMDYIARWDNLAGIERWHALQAAVHKRVESAYPFICRILESSEGGEYLARLIVTERIQPLVPAALGFLEKNFEKITWIEFFKSMGQEDATRILLKRLRHMEGRTAETLRILGERGTRAAADEAATYLTNTDWEIRAAAVDCLAGIGEPRHSEAVGRVLREYLRQANKAPSFNVSNCIKLLARWSAAGEIESLLDFMPQCGFFGQEFDAAVERLRPPGAGERLVPFLKHKDRMIALRAVDLMGKVGAELEARANVDAIKALFTDPSAGHGISQAAQSVARLGLRELIPVFIEQRRNHLFQPVGLILAQLWTREEKLLAVKSPDPKMREAGLMALVASEGWEKDADALMPLVRDPDRDVRWMLATPFKQPLSQSGALILLELSRDQDPEIARRAAGNYFHSIRLDLLPKEETLALLKHPSAAIRAGALDYVSREDMIENVMILDALRKDPAPEVRKKLAAPRLFPDAGAESEIKRRLKEERNGGELWHTLYELGNMNPAERAGPLVRYLLERILAETPSTIKAGYWSRDTISSADHPIGLDRVLDEAAHVAVRARADDLEPVLLRMLAPNRPELHKAAASALGGLGCRDAIPRLVELVPTAAGDAAAEALGNLKAAPLELLKHSSPEVRSRALKSIKIAGDPGAYEPLCEAARGMQGKEFQEAMETLGGIARPEQAGRFLEFVKTPMAEDRRAVLIQLRRFPRAEFADAVAEFLDDNYYVHFVAADFILQSGDARYARKAARRTSVHFPDRAARIISRFGLREEAPLLLKWFEIPGNSSMESVAIEAASTFADLGLKEHFPAVLAKMKALSTDSHRAMIPVAARLGGKDAVSALLEDLQGPEPKIQLAAFEALADLGVDLPMDGVREAIRRDLWDATACRLIIKLHLSDLAQESIAKGEKQGYIVPQALAVASRLGVPGASEKTMKALEGTLQEQVIAALQLAWGSPDEVRGWDAYDYRTVRSLIAKIEQKSGRMVVLAGPVPEGFLERVIQASVIRHLLYALPGKWSYFIDDQGRIVVDRFEKVREAWIGRLKG